MDLESVIKSVAETIQREATTKAVFGEPVKLDEHIIVPVAVVHVALGGGGGGSRLPAKLEKVIGGMAGGGGGGMDVTTVPIGFLSERDGVVAFTAIPHPDPKKLQHGPADQPLVDRIRAALAKH